MAICPGANDTCLQEEAAGLASATSNDKFGIISRGVRRALQKVTYHTSQRFHTSVHRDKFLALRMGKNAVIGRAFFTRPSEEHVYAHVTPGRPPVKILITDR